MCLIWEVVYTLFPFINYFKLKQFQLWKKM